MVDPRDLQLSSYDYRLPEERIAQAPMEPRHAARLLMAPALSRPAQDLMHRQVWDWQEELRSGDLIYPLYRLWSIFFSGVRFFFNFGKIDMNFFLQIMIGGPLDRKFFGGP